MFYKGRDPSSQGSPKLARNLRTPQQNLIYDSKIYERADIKGISVSEYA